MAIEPAYTVSGYSESIETVIPPSGAIRRIKRVRFMVGDNGPYSLTFELNEDNPDNIAAQINRQVSMLRATHAKLNQGV